MAASAASARAGIAPGREISVSNASFSAGLAGWTAVTSNGLPHVTASNGPAGNRPCVRVQLPNAINARILRSLPVGLPGSAIEHVPQPGEKGAKLEMGAWVWIGGDCTQGTLALELHSWTGAADTLIASTTGLDTSAPRDRWIFVRTTPVGATDARIQPNAGLLQLVLRSTLNGTVYFDDVLAGRFDRSDYPLVAGGFEEATQFSAWLGAGPVSLNDPVLEPEAIWGARYAELTGEGRARLTQLVPLGGAGNQPHVQQLVEVGAWLYFENGAALPASSDPQQFVELSVRAWRADAPFVPSILLTSRRWHPISDDDAQWKFIRTQSQTPLPIPLDATHLIVDVRKSVRGPIRVDAVQVGEVNAVHGVPPRMVSGHYVGRFRSPLWPGCTTAPSDPRAIWGTWAWTAPPACDVSFVANVHNPDCATSAQCFRANGRRNVAVTTEPGLDEVPLAGAYDSRDVDVVRWHAKLARAMGIDSFVYDYNGARLAQVQIAQGAEPINQKCLEVLLDVAEEPGIALKVALMYEPKVHFNGWIPGEPTLAAKKLGVIADLVALAQDFGARRSVLRYDGRIVVFVFFNQVCTPSGSQCLSDADWAEIAAAVEAQIGEPLWLVADDVPVAGDAFRGVSRWGLLSNGILRYATFAAFRAHVPTIPQPILSALDAHANAIQWMGEQWTAQNDPSRVQVAVAWPGFDDSGVSGWGDTNLLGTDGQPLCVRVAANFGGAFFPATLASAFDSGADWVQVATWNDWNEWTQIEPVWSAEYAAAVLAGVHPSNFAFEHAFARAIEAQSWIAGFKGTVASPGDLHLVTADYLRRAAFDPFVTQYD